MVRCVGDLMNIELGRVTKTRFLTIKSKCKAVSNIFIKGGSDQKVMHSFYFNRVNQRSTLAPLDRASFQLYIYFQLS